MPYSTVTYTADGTETDFLITWNYLDTDHIAVEVGGVDTTDGSSTHTFSLIDSTTVRVINLSSNPVTNGVLVKLKRVTPIDTRAVTFAEGSALRTTDLNKNSDFLLYSMQEAIDTIDVAASEGAAIASAEAQAAKTSAETAQANAEAALDEFTDLYLGSKTTNPSLDNDGDALQTGALYFNTSENKVKLYNGLTWTDAASAVNGTANRQNYTATASQTTFNITYDVGFVDVYMNGVKLINGTDFTATNGTSVILTTGADLGDVLDVIAYGTFNLSNHYTVSQVDADFVTKTGTEMTKLATIDDSANNYVHPSVNHIPTGGTVGQILENSASGTAVWADASSGASGHVTMKFDEPDTYTWTAPEDCTVVIQAVGAGGSGGGISRDDTANLEAGASGGSGGGYSRKTVSLNASDTLTFTVGAGGARETLYDNSADHTGIAGGNTTLTGPSGLSMTANGGSGGSGRRVGSGIITYATQPTGGTASGGDVNIAGQAGTNVSNFTPPFANNDVYLWSGGTFSCGYENISVQSQDDYNHTNAAAVTNFFEYNAKVGSVLYATSNASKGYMAGAVSGLSGAVVVTGGNAVLGSGGGAACNISGDSDTGVRTVNTGAGGDGAIFITVINL